MRAISILLCLAPALCLVVPSSIYRLDTSILDVHHYDINIINIDEDTNTFMGVVNIDINLKNGTEIQLHQQNITMTTINLGGDHQCKESTYDESTQISVLICENAEPGAYNLTIIYTGMISTEDMEGFYVSKYEENEVGKTLLATQFEPTYARRLFPCFDEPQWKATFQITVKHDTKYIPLSNTPVISTTAIESDVQTKFGVTPPMSTYLLALVLSEFEFNNNTETFKVWSRPEAKKYTETAASNLPKLIEKLSSFTKLEYTSLGIDKSDLVAIPDFAWGAMENWGLVTFRESDLLDEADKTTAAGKQKVITVVAHELAHQWFGDYVTLEWWSETWLNEGFATFFEYHIPDLLQDDFDLDKQFLIDVVQPVMILDSVSSVQALVSKDDDVNTLAEINDKFGDISYNKGGSILRMVHNVLGGDEFAKALNNYLSSHTNENVGHDDLIKVLGEYGENFRKWFEQPGYPLVTASWINDSLYLEQEHYTTNKTEQTWDIPIALRTSHDTKYSLMWVTEPDHNYVFLNEGDWVILNWDQTGYFRVKYDSKLFNQILNALKENPEQISELTRAQLIDDTFNLAITGQTTYQQAFSLIEYLSKETAYAPWASTFNVITVLLQKIENDFILSSIQLKLLQLMDKVITIPANISDLPFDSHIETIKNIAILKAACSFGHSQCVTFAQTVFDSYLKDKNIDNNYRGFSLCTALKNSAKQQENWNKLWDAFGKSETSHEKDDLLLALGCASDKTVLQGYLLKSIDEKSGIRKQDANNVLKAVLASGQVGVEAALDFMIGNIEEIQKYYKGVSAIPNMITGIAKLLVSESDVEKLKQFIQENQDTIPEVKVVASQAIEMAENNVKWSTEKLVELEKLFPKPVDGANSINYSFGILIAAIIFLFTS